MDAVHWFWVLLFDSECWVQGPFRVSNAAGFNSGAAISLRVV